MEFCFILIEFVVIVISLRSIHGEDLLDSIQLSDRNPPELNDFLHSVLERKDDFELIRQAARRKIRPQQHAHDNSFNVGSTFRDKGTNLIREKHSLKNKKIKNQPRNDVYPYMYSGDLTPQRYDRHVFGHGGNKKYRFKSQGNPFRFKRSPVSNGHKYRNVKISPMSETGVLLNKAQYELQQNQNKILRIRSINETQIKENITSSTSPRSKKESGAPTNHSSEETTAKQTTPPEFYFTVDHDILGLKSDIENEFKNETFTTKKPHKHKTRRLPKELFNISQHATVYNDESTTDKILKKQVNVEAMRPSFNFGLDKHMLHKRFSMDGHIESELVNSPTQNEYVETSREDSKNEDSNELHFMPVQKDGLVEKKLAGTDASKENNGNSNYRFPSFIVQTKLDNLNALEPKSEERSVKHKSKTNHEEEKVLKIKNSKKTKSQTDKTETNVNTKTKITNSKSKMARHHKKHENKSNAIVNEDKFAESEGLREEGNHREELADKDSYDIRDQSEVELKQNKYNDLLNEEELVITPRRNNIFLEARQKEQQRKSIDLPTLRIINDRSRPKQLFNTHMKNPIESIHEMDFANPPQIDHYKLIQKTLPKYHLKPAKAHNFKVIEIEEGLDVSNTPNPLFKAKNTKSKIVHQKKQNLLSFENTNKVDISKSLQNKTQLKAQTRNRKYSSTPYNAIVNKLEDETAPTSAIEQNELGKTTYLPNLNFSTAMSETTTHIIIVRTTSEGESFKVKEAKDMIHINPDQFEEINKRDFVELETNDDYNDEGNFQYDPDNSIDEEKDILGQDSRLHDTFEEENLEGLTNILSNQDAVNNELEKVSTFENNYIFNDRKRDSNTFQKRKLQSMEDYDILNENEITSTENDILSLSTATVANSSDVNTSNEEGSNLDSAKTDDYTYVDYENKGIKKRLTDLFGVMNNDEFSDDNSESAFADYNQDSVGSEDDDEEEADPYVGKKLTYNINKTIIKDNVLPSIYSAKSADSPEARDAMDTMEEMDVEFSGNSNNQNASRTVPMARNNDDSIEKFFKVPEHRVTYNYVPPFNNNNMKVPPLTFGFSTNNREKSHENAPVISHDKIDQDHENNILFSSGFKNKSPNNNPVLYNPNNLNKAKQSSEHEYKVPTKNAPDGANNENSGENSQMEVKPEPLKAEETSTTRTTLSNLGTHVDDVESTKKSIPGKASEFIIHIIKTSAGEEDGDFLDMARDLVSYSRSKDQAHNKILAKAEPKRENVKNQSESRDPLTAKEGPVIIETEVDPLSKKMDDFKSANKKKRSKLETLTDHLHGGSEPQFLAPLSLNEFKTDAIRSVNKKEKQTAPKNKKASSLLNSVESFKDVVEITENKNKKLRKRDTTLDTKQDALLTPELEQAKFPLQRRKRRLKYFKSDEIADGKKDDKGTHSLSQRLNAMHNLIARKARKARHKKKNKVPPKEDPNEDSAKNVNETFRYYKSKRPPDDIAQIRDLLTGHMAKRIIDTVFDKVKKNERLFNEFGKFILEITAAEEVNMVDEYRKAQARIEIKRAQRMLHEVIESLNNIILAQVHHRLCQHPPMEVKKFLIKITKKPKLLGHVAESYPLPQASGSLDHQPYDMENGKFLFPQANEEESNAVQVKKKIGMITKLLDKYERMSSKCKVQVEPVRDYLIDHLKMLTDLANGGKSPTAEEGSNPGSNSSSIANPSEGSEVNADKKEPSVQGDLNKMGLGSKKSFVSPFDLDKYIEDAIRGQKEMRRSETQQNINSNVVKRETKIGKTNWGVSEKYKKLVQTAAKIRLKRESEEKLGKLFGQKINKSNIGHDVKDYSQIKFESPVVYSLDH